MRIIILVIAVMALVSCSGTQSKIQNSLDRKMLSSTIGKNYQALSVKNKMTLSSLVGNDPLYGAFVSSYNLPNGNTVMRHMDRYTSGSTQILPGMPVSLGSQSVAYRLFYFNVGRDGTVKDWASGFYNGAKQKCLGIAGMTLSTCGNLKNDLNFSQIDDMVTTSSGASIKSWTR